MGNLLDTVRYELERDAGIARARRRELNDKREAELEAERDYLATIAPARSLSPAVRTAPPPAPTPAARTVPRETSRRETAADIVAKGARVTRTRDGCEIEGRHLTTKRRQMIAKMVRDGASNAQIIDSLPDPGPDAPKEKLSCVTALTID